MLLVEYMFIHCVTFEKLGKIDCHVLIVANIYLTIKFAQQIANISKEETFDLSAWRVNRLGLNVNSECEMNRLNELMAAFRKAGFRTRELVESNDNESIDAINSELTEEMKLKGGEKRDLNVLHTKMSFRIKK